MLIKYLKSGESVWTVNMGQPTVDKNRFNPPPFAQPVHLALSLSNEPVIVIGFNDGCVHVYSIGIKRALLHQWTVKKVSEQNKLTGIAVTSQDEVIVCTTNDVEVYHMSGKFIQKLTALLERFGSTVAEVVMSKTGTLLIAHHSGEVAMYQSKAI